MSRRRRVVAPRATVEEVAVKARVLFVQGAAARIWSTAEKVVPALSRHEDAIVWLEPPSDAPDGLIETVAEGYRRSGAAKVVVLPRVSGASVLPQSERDAIAAHPAAPDVPAASRVREVVAELVVATKIDASARADLALMLDRYLSRAGL